MINNSQRYHDSAYVSEGNTRPYTPSDDAITINAHTVSENTITVFEHQRLTARDFLHVSDFHWLMAQEFAVFTIKRKQGQWQLKAGHYIGIILLPSGMILELLPKLHPSTQVNDIAQTRHWVQGMLSDLTHLNTRKNSKLPNMKNLGQFSYQSMALPIEAPPLSDWLMAQFLQRLLHYQPTQHYHAQINNQSSLQGRLLIKEQLRRNNTQPHKFVCESSVLSQDMLANRLIKSALVYLMPLFSQSAFSKSIFSKSMCSNVLPSWQQVSVLNPREVQRLASIYTQAKQQLEVQPLQRQKLRVAQQLLDLAYWLLQQSNVAAGYGINPTQSKLSQPRLCLLIDMNQAFEQWASERIASMFEQISCDYRPFYQTQSVWLNDSEGQACLSIRPDLLIYKAASDNSHQNQSTNAITKNEEKGRYSHVIDIKWKSLPHAAAISASDAYQLTSYAQAYQAGQVWMVYPVLGGERQPVALKQQIRHDSNSNDISNNNDTKNKNSNHAHLWLIPFDVLTGTVKGEVFLDRVKECV